MTPNRAWSRPEPAIQASYNSPVCGGWLRRLMLVARPLKTNIANQERNMKKIMIAIPVLCIFVRVGTISAQNTDSQATQQSTTNEQTKMTQKEISSLVRSATTVQLDKMRGRVFDISCDIADVRYPWGDSKEDLGLYSFISADSDELAFFVKDSKLKKTCEGLKAGESVTIRARFDSRTLIPSNLATLGGQEIPGHTRINFDVLNVQRQKK